MTDPVKAYLASIGRRGGKAAGGDKAAAARENGKRGGRPKGKATKRKSSNTSMSAGERSEAK